MVKKEQKRRFKSSKAFKLRDKKGRNFIVINMKSFGFVPDVLVIEKVKGQNNTFVVIAPLTDEQEKVEDKMIKDLAKQHETTNG